MCVLSLCLLNCEDDSNYGANLAYLLREWFDLAKEQAQIELAVFNAKAQEYPSENRWNDYHGYIIGGSLSAAYDEPEIKWIQDLSSLLRRLASRGHKLFGICFGHQILAQALGGKVAKNSYGFQTGKRLLMTHREVLSSYVKEKDNIPEKLELLVSHGDIVTELPPGAKSFGTSSTNAYEGFILSDQVLTMQPHPEFGGSKIGREIMIRINESLYRKGYISESKKLEANNEAMSSQTDDTWVLHLMIQFFQQPGLPN